MPADPPRVKELFSAALELAEPEARRDFIDRQCADNPELRERLQELLAAHDRPNAILNQPFAPPAEPTADLPADDVVGTIIAGRYKLIEQIGEGGMGTVWMAEQREPVRRLVALKLIKPGMDSRAVQVRFEAERQALALMDHPNIAKILDGGMTGIEAGGIGPGRPYFVMELVKGLPLADYCDERRLSVRERLSLFVQVCQAVQHAHQKGIIHRDLKPTNLLVTEHDGHPVPKVIDFGLAKALHGPMVLTEKTLHTSFGAMVGTPTYMAPEQVAINALDVDTRTDIYALGVILYELLTGSTPLQKRQLKEAAWDEIRRLIREEEPIRPSLRLSTSDALPSVAARRQIEPAKLSRLVQGDLDWIVLKALEKDRNRRYETASAFALDVQRHLADEPVLAGPPTAAYRIRKFARKHRAVMISASAFIVLLIAGTIISLRQAGRAKKAEADARSERDSAHAARDDAKEQLKRAVRAEQATSEALRRSEGLRLATTALLKRAHSYDLATALAHEAVTVSDVPSTLGAALAAVDGLPLTRRLARAELPATRFPGANPRWFQPRSWFAFHPDGRRLFALDREENDVVVFDQTTLQPVRQFPVRSTGAPSLDHLIMDPQGRWLVGANNVGGLTVWSAESGNLVGRHSLDGFKFQELAFSPQNGRLAAVAWRTSDAAPLRAAPTAIHRLVVWSMPDFVRRIEFEAPEQLRSVVLSRTGGRVALSSVGNRSIRVWNLPSGDLTLEEREGDGLPFPALAFSYDESQLLDFVREGVSVWDIAARKKMLIPYQDQVRRANGISLVRDADGTVLLVSPSVGTFNLHTRQIVLERGPLLAFDLRKLQWLPPIDTGSNAKIYSASLSGNGRRAVVRTDNAGMIAWDVSQDSLLVSATHSGLPIEAIAISPDGTTAVTQIREKGLWRWDLDDRGILPAVSGNNTLICEGGRRLSEYGGAGRMRTLEAATLRTVDRATLNPELVFDRDVYLLDDGRRLLFVKQPGTVVLCSSTGEQIARYEFPRSAISAGSYRSSNLAQQVLTAKEGGRRFLLPVSRKMDPFDRTAKFNAYDSTTGRLVSTVDLGDALVKCALGPDGCILAGITARSESSQWAYDLEFWSLDTGALLGRRPIPKSSSSESPGLAYAAGGARLLCWQGRTATIWDVDTRAAVRSLTFEEPFNWELALSRNGRLLASDSPTEFALWDAVAGKNLYRVPHPDRFPQRVAFVAEDSMVLVDADIHNERRLSLLPVDPALHFRNQNLRRLTDAERTEFGIQSGPKLSDRSASQ
jgi:serine/threonine protein kinase/WD40 repeat protein